jgi:hypothetical protein
MASAVSCVVCCVALMNQAALESHVAKAHPKYTKED